jgi:hypothetical protein
MMLRSVRARLLAIFAVGALFLSAFLLLPTIVQNTVCSSASLVKAHLENLGFTPGTFVINPTTPITAADAASTRGTAAFNQAGVYSNDQLKQYLSSNDPNALVAQQKIDEILAGRTVSWVPVYFSTQIDIVGNLGIDSSGVFSANTRSGAGELIWFPVSQGDCKVIDGLVIIAHCGNPAASVQPPCITEGSCTPKCPPGNHIPDCAPKDPSKDPAQQGNDGGMGNPNQNPGLDAKTDKPVIPDTPYVAPSAPAPKDPPAGSTPAPSPTATPIPEGGGLNS